MLSKLEKNLSPLLEACKKGNQKAYLEIYTRYHKMMYNTAYRITTNEATAEDAMQEAFIAAFKKLNSLSSEVYFSAWLKKIVINKSITILKKENKYQPFLDQEPETLIRDTDEGYAEKNRKIEPQKILESLTKLKSNYRIILTLQFIEGYDLNEIASIMKISYANARTTISRAKKKFKEQLLTDYGTQF